MLSQYSRTEMLLGEEGVARLRRAHVAVFGVGGVGGFAVEALARAGVARLTLVDSDTVTVTNLNRQIAALHSTLGRYKTEVLRDRVLDIDPTARVEVKNCFYLPETAGDFDFSQYSYVVDAVDTVTAKLSIVLRAKETGVPVISAMGAGNKLDPSRFRVSDVFETSVCPLARVMRQELKKRGVRDLKVVFSDEPPHSPRSAASEEKGGRPVPGSVSFVPAAAGLLLAGEVIRDLALGGAR